MTADEASPTEPRSRLRRWILPVLAAVAGIALLLYFLAPYRDEVRTAFDRASLGTLLAITALSLIALPLRTEVWRAGLAAAGRHPPRSDLHAANSASLVASLANHYIAPGAKMWLLRKMEGEQATVYLKLVTIDLATTVIEAFLAGALVIFAASQVSLQWWIPAVLLVGASVLLLVTMRGLAAPSRSSGDRRPQRPDAPALSLGSAVATDACVRRADLADVAVAACGRGSDRFRRRSAGVRAHRRARRAPNGVTAAPTAASLIVVGSKGVGPAAASGILVTGSLVVATLAYCVFSFGTRLLVRRRHPGPSASAGAALERGSRHGAP